ncbi:MAG: hypothetical protein A2X49_16735 [Lentisphaerae bacterium GWF2_52_8]|nr:MAG: hypothetical protein A2X49_16735 [Lentisphaerae bacterium GWF2_52_8]
MSTKKNARIIQAPRRLDATNAAEFKAQVLLELENEGSLAIIDFSNTHFLDSAALGALVSILKSVANAAGGRKVALASLSEQVRQLFELTRLYRLFDVYASASEAEHQLKD